MKKTISIAILTFKEAIREKILYNLIVFALIFIGVGAEAAYFVIGDWERIVKDISLSSIEIFGVLISVFLGVGLIAKEVDRKTAYAILSKPVSRTSFVLGKYLGLLMILGLNSIIMLIALFIALLYARSPVEFVTIQAFVLIFFQFMIIGGFALLFSTFTTPTLGAIISLTLYVIGHLSHDLQYFTSEKFSPLFRWVAKFFYLTLPNLEILNVKPLATYSTPVEGAYFLNAIVYGICYSVFLITVAVLIFRRRDLK
ncbi:MAG TPA: ABC transporter permease [bacterium]